MVDQAATFTASRVLATPAPGAPPQTPAPAAPPTIVVIAAAARPFGGGRYLSDRHLFTVCLRPTRLNYRTGPYPAKGNPFPFRSGIWLPCDYGTTT